MIFLKNYRVMVWIVFIVSVIGVMSSLVAQYVFGMNPCVMCIQQRLALIGIMLLALLCLLLPLSKLWARSVAVLLISAPTVFGLYIALSQIYLQSLPFDEQPSCGAPWTFRWRDQPNKFLFDLYEPLIRGTGSCGEVYHVLGVALPIWGAIFFVLVLGLTWFIWFCTRKNKY